MDAIVSPFAEVTTSSAVAHASRRALWIGGVLTAVPTLFLAFDAAMKLLRMPQAVEGTVALGYPPGVLVPLGLVQLACLVAYLLPRTAVLGAILWTGYLGGAVATHVRLENPLFTHTLFPIYVAVLLWAGLWLRRPSLRSALRQN